MILLLIALISIAAAAFVFKRAVDHYLFALDRVDKDSKSLAANSMDKALMLTIIWGMLLTIAGVLAYASTC